MWERGRYSTTTLAQPRTPCRPRHPYAVPRTSLQCVCTRRRNCIEQLSPSPKYAPRLTRFPVGNSATNQTTGWEGRLPGVRVSLVLGGFSGSGVPADRRQRTGRPRRPGQEAIQPSAASSRSRRCACRAILLKWRFPSLRKSIQTGRAEIASCCLSRCRTAIDEPHRPVLPIPALGRSSCCHSWWRPYCTGRHTRGLLLASAPARVWESSTC